MGTLHFVCAVVVYIACLGKYLMSSNAADERERKAVQSAWVGTGREVGEISELQKMKPVFLRTTGRRQAVVWQGTTAHTMKSMVTSVACGRAGEVPFSFKLYFELSFISFYFTKWQYQ